VHGIPCSAARKARVRLRWPPGRSRADFALRGLSREPEQSHHRQYRVWQAGLHDLVLPPVARSLRKRKESKSVREASWAPPKQLTDHRTEAGDFSRKIGRASGREWMSRPGLAVPEDG